MILSLLFTALAVVMLVQPTAPRFFAVAVFLCATLIHDMALTHLDGFLYYGSAALLDLFIIGVTSGIQPTPNLVIDLHRICMLSMVANLAGWLLWLAYFPPITYDVVFIGLYSWALWLFVKKDGCDVGGYSMASWSSCFRFGYSPGAQHSIRHDG